MDEKTKKKKEYLTLGILASADSGKTTLSEAMLYKTGAINTLGRVDKGNTFLDTDGIEKARGITIFSKEAVFSLGNKEVTLLDTPGHMDFSGEMERNLEILDLAILMINGKDGITGHTMTLWKLLKTYEIPTIIFVNKMDQIGVNKLTLKNQINVSFGNGISQFYDGIPINYEETCLSSENLLEEYLDSGTISQDSLMEAIAKRELFPLCFGSALKVEGLDTILNLLLHFNSGKSDESKNEEFSAIVYKITRDAKGNRQTHLKVTSGQIENKMVIHGKNIKQECFEEKVHEIRKYSGLTYENLKIGEKGTTVAITGPVQTYAGQFLGKIKKKVSRPILVPTFIYTLNFKEGVNMGEMLKNMEMLGEEYPTLSPVWVEKINKIQIHVMGDLELDVLKIKLKERFGQDVEFSKEKILYKETIQNPVLGVGHYEPFKHYGEVILYLEPLPLGSGIDFKNLLKEEGLSFSRQSQVLKALMEYPYIGPLLGAQLTDVRISLIGGRESRYTDGGDFREATYRAIRQALIKSVHENNMVLLEPMVSFHAEVPTENIGRVMSDMDKFGAELQNPILCADSQMTAIDGLGPVSKLSHYEREVLAFTSGRGKFMITPEGYGVCKRQDEIVRESGYYFNQEEENSSSSIFYKNGESIFVKWDQVEEYIHLDKKNLTKNLGKELKLPLSEDRNKVYRNNDYDEQDLESIFLRTYGKSKRDEQLKRMKSLNRTLKKSQKIEDFPQPMWKKKDEITKKNTESVDFDKYIVIDGYNVIFAWEELKEMAHINLDSARENFLDLLVHYQGYTGFKLVVVFDGYRVKGNRGSTLSYGEVEVVFTKEGETADRFIEETIYKMGRAKKITVVTSDLPVQMAALGDGAIRMSAREFKENVLDTFSHIKERLSKERKASYTPLKALLEDKDF